MVVKILREAPLLAAAVYWARVAAHVAEAALRHVAAHAPRLRLSAKGWQLRAALWQVADTLSPLVADTLAELRRALANVVGRLLGHIAEVAERLIPRDLAADVFGQVARRLFCRVEGVG